MMHLTSSSFCICSIVVLCLVVHSTQHAFESIAKPWDDTKSDSFLDTDLPQDKHHEHMGEGSPLPCSFLA
jgi:hypothetical protein